MKQSTIVKYTKILLDVKASGKKLSKYCAENNLSYNNIVSTISTLKKQNNEESREIEELIKLYNEVTCHKLNSKEILDTDDKSKVAFIRDETGKISSYHYQIYRRNKPSLVGNLTREEMNTIHRLYSYYGDSLTQRVISRHFGDLSLIDFKSISSLHLVGNGKELFFLLQILEILDITSIKVFWTKLQDSEVEKINNQQFDISIIKENFLNLNETRIKDYVIYICKKEIKKSFKKTIKKYSFKTKATLSQYNGDYEVVFSVQDEILLRSFFSFQKQIVNTVDNVNPIKKKMKKLIRNPKAFFKDFIKKKLR